MSLTSWNDTPTKQTFLDFVAKVRDQNSPDCIPPVERIATFDNDSTLWCEHLVPAQFNGALDALTLLAEKDLGWFAPYWNKERISKLFAIVGGRCGWRRQTRSLACCWMCRH